jgi:hypothetical protein
MKLNRTPERGHLPPAVIPRRFGGPVCRHFSSALAPRDRTGISAAGMACGGAAERVKQANRPAGERRLRHRSLADYPFCGSATGPSSQIGIAQ